MTERRGGRAQPAAAAVLGALRDFGPQTRTELSGRTGLPRSSVFVVVGELIERGAVREREAVARGRGRPAASVELDPDAALVIGVDCGRGHLRVVVVNAAHQVLALGTAPSGGSGRVARARRVNALIEGVCADNGIDLAPLQLIVVGVAGRPDDADPVAGVVGDHFEVDVLTGNNTRYAALAESAWGAGRGARTLLYLHWATGVGGAVVVDGQVLDGRSGSAGDIGHVSIDPAGARCRCGGHGCLELAVGAPALLARAAQHGRRPRNLDALLRQARDGTGPVASVVGAAAEQVGRVAAAAAVVLDPDRVVLGGDLAVLGSLVLDPVRDALARLTMPALRASIEVVAAEFGGAGPAHGAAALGLRSLSLAN